MAESIAHSVRTMLEVGGLRLEAMRKNMLEVRGKKVRGNRLEVVGQREEAIFCLKPQTSNLQQLLVCLKPITYNLQPVIRNAQLATRSAG